MTYFPLEVVLEAQRKLLTTWIGDETIAVKIEQISIPTLILSGGKDTAVPPANSLFLSKNIRASEWVSWKEGGHAMVFQFPVEIADAIIAFLKKN